jgi:hypothetical protein
MLIALVDVWRIAQPLVTVSATDVPPMWKAMAAAVPGSPHYRVMTVPNDITWQAGAIYSRHLNANGYDPLVSDAYQRLLDASGYNPSSPIARLLGVRYVISDTPYQGDSVSEVARDGNWHIYEVANPLPRAFVATSMPVMDDGAAREALASGTIDPVRTAVVDRAVCGVNPLPLTPSPGLVEEEQESPRIVTYAPNVVEMALTSDQPGVLVLTDSYDPNWTVTVDGAPAQLLRVDTALRGVCLDAGDHQVRFEYQPRAFYVGAAISVAGWLVWGIMGAVVLIGWRRKGGAVGAD